ncbi:MAG: carbon starvation protein A, partial [Ruminococcus sp.]|nr:carbon starvation protein A [Ruminococcus sp.]
VAGILIYAKSDANGFNMMWRYFSWANETIAAFSFTLITVYMVEKKMPFIMALIPGMFYTYVVTCYILNAAIGFNLSWTLSYMIAGVLTAAYTAALMIYSKKRAKRIG